MDVEIVTLAERPALMDTFWDLETSWPEFMKHDPIGNGYYASLEHFAEFVLVCLDASGREVAKAHSVPFRLDDDELPDAGWDVAIRSGLLTRAAGRGAERRLRGRDRHRPDLQGTGLSGRIVAALRDNAGRLGFPELLAPVRPNGKTDVHESMAAYAAPHPRRRAARRPVAARARAGGRTDRPGRAALDGHPRHGRGVAGVDRAGRSTAPARSTCPGRWRRSVRRRARHGDLRRAQRVGQAPHRRVSAQAPRPPCGPR